MSFLSSRRRNIGWIQTINHCVFDWIRSLPLRVSRYISFSLLFCKNSVDILIFNFSMWPCACIPCCMQDLRDKKHICPNCGHLIGIQKASVWIAHPCRQAFKYVLEQYYVIKVTFSDPNLFHVFSILDDFYVLEIFPWNLRLVNLRCLHGLFLDVIETNLENVSLDLTG